MSIYEVSWDEVKDQVKQVNPDFFETIDSIASASTKLYLASYKFGDLIVNNGITQLPINDNLIPLSHPDLPEPFKTDLFYSEMCAGMFLNKTAEVFADLEMRTHPLHMFRIGDFYGLWEILDSQNSPYYHRMWSVAAGARNLFLVPKTADTMSLNKMQRALNLEDVSPHNLFMQGALFKDIANSNFFNSHWRCDVLYFSRAWFESLPKEAWMRFHYTCLRQEWIKSTHPRNRMTFEVMWQMLSQTQAETRLKPNVYIFETVKHLINIAVSAFLGFQPLNAEHDEHIAPIKIIEQAYLEFYKLKHYTPTLLAPAYLNHQDGTAVYYSFMLPTLLSLSIEHNFRNTLEDERNIKHLVERFQKRLMQQNDALGQYVANTHFNFFHYEADPVYQINATTTLPQFDPRFNSHQDSKRSFCENGPFIRSCVMIKPKQAI